MKLRIFLFLLTLATPALADLNWTPGPPATAPYSFEIGATAYYYNDAPTVNLFKEGSLLASWYGYFCVGGSVETTADGETTFYCEESINNESLDAVVNQGTGTEPYAVESMQATLKPTSIILSWAPAVFYRNISYQITRDDAWWCVTGDTSVLIQRLTQGQTYQFAVTPLGEGNIWGPTSTISVLFSTQPGATLSSTEQTATTINLAWSTPVDSTGLSYDLFLTSTYGIQYIATATPAAQSYTDVQFPSGSYSYKFRARDSLGTVSGWSNTVSVTTPAASDADTDSIPNHLEGLFSPTANPTTSSSSAIQLNIHKP